MAETTVINQEPIKTQIPPVDNSTVQNKTETPNSSTVETTGDILTRVSKKKEIPKELTPEEAAQTFKEFDAITDPILKAEAIKKYKEVQSYATKTNQEKIALQKQFEEFQKQSQNWTPERIQRELLNNPQFIQAAQQVNTTQNPAGSGLTDEQFSALTPAEKNQLLQVPELKTKINQLEQQNFITAVTQRHTLLSTKYGDYDILKVNQAYKDLASMNAMDTLEYVYKSINHDEHVNNAYELGLAEGKGLTQTRQQASTQTGLQTLASDKRPVRDPKESDISYFSKLANARLEQRRAEVKR